MLVKIGRTGANFAPEYAQNLCWAQFWHVSAQVLVLFLRARLFYLFRRTPQMRCWGGGRICCSLDVLPPPGLCRLQDIATVTLRIAPCNEGCRCHSVCDEDRSDEDTTTKIARRHTTPIYAMTMTTRRWRPRAARGHGHGGVPPDDVRGLGRRAGHPRAAVGEHQLLGHDAVRHGGHRHERRGGAGAAKREVLRDAARPLFRRHWPKKRPTILEIGCLSRIQAS